MLSLVILAVLIALAVVFALQARTAYAELRAAMPQVTDLREQALGGQSDAAAATATGLQEHTGRARDAVSGPHWSLAARLPWAGPSIEAARTTTEVVDDLATDALPELVAATDVVTPARLAPQDGRIDLAPFTEVAPQIRRADTAVGQAQGRLASIDTTEVLGPFRGRAGGRCDAPPGRGPRSIPSTHSQPMPSLSRSRCEAYPGSSRYTGAAPASRAAVQFS